MASKITIEQTACEWGVPVSEEENERLHDAYEARVLATLAKMFPSSDVTLTVQRRMSGGLDYVRAYDEDGEPDERTEDRVRGVLGESWVHTCEAAS